MSLLNLNGPVGKIPGAKRNSRAWMGFGLVIAVLGIGSTFASSITINPAGNTEFGQGVEKAVYCGNSTQTLTVAPISAYRNSSNDSTPGTFYLSGLLVSKIPAACDGVNFVFSIYDSSDNSTTPYNIATVSGSTISVPAVYWRTTGSSSKYVDSSDRSSTSNCNKANTAASSNTTTYGGLLSLSRLQYSSPCAVAYLTAKDATSFQINIRNGGTTSTNTNIIDASRIVVETQNDTFGATTLALTSGNAYGLVRDGLS